MLIQNKPIDYILCEGASDARFIALYIEKMFSYEFDSNKSKAYKQIVDHSFYVYLKGETRDTLVISCAGCGNIDKIFKEIVYQNILHNGVNARVIVAVDRDNKTDSECLKLIRGCSSKISISINKWTLGHLYNQFVKPDGSRPLIDYESYFAVIPSDEPGAFETILISAIASEYPTIYKEVSDFFTTLSLGAKEFISRPRKEAKAKLDTMIILIDPESMYCTLDKMFSLIDLNDPSITSSYSFLDSIVKPIG